MHPRIAMLIAICTDGVVPSLYMMCARSIELLCGLKEDVCIVHTLQPWS